MKIVDKRKFIRSLIIIGGFILMISFICASKTLSHSNTNYKTIYVSSGDTLWTIAKEEKNKSAQHMTDKEVKSKETKKDKEKGQITSEGVNLVNGRVVVTEELDAAILKSFGKCSVMKLFTHDE